MNFWQDKKVLITGHTGFKGSWLSLWLTQLGAKVVGYALEPDTNPNLFTLLQLEQDLEHIVADVRDFERLKSVIDSQQPEIVFHLAAQPLVRRAYEEPVENYATNVMGTVNLLEALRFNDSVQAIVNVTTDKCYFNDGRKTAYQEDDKLGGYDPYSNSKACSELVSSAYRDSYFKGKIATARAGNVIGGGDWSADRLIPDCIMSFIEHKEVNIRYPNAVRPWQHVLESLSGYLCLAQCLYENPNEYAEAWNFGPDESEIARVEDVVNYLGQHWPGNPTWEVDSQSHPHEADFLMIASNKSKTRLDWQPRWSVYQALDKVIAWYAAWHAGEDLRALSLKQIKEFKENK